MKHSQRFFETIEQVTGLIPLESDMDEIKKSAIADFGFQKMNKNLDGINFLRQSIDFFDNRPEFENSDKSPILLLEEFLLTLSS